MEEQEVDICSCIAAANKENIGVIENVQKYKDKLFGIGYVNVKDMEHSLKMLRENVDEEEIQKQIILQEKIGNFFTWFETVF